MSYFQAEPDEAKRFDNTVRFVCQEDKDRRLDVERIIPTGGFEVDRHEAMGLLAEMREGAFVMPDFRFEHGGSKSPELSDGWTGGNFAGAPAKVGTTAKAAVAHILEIATGMTTEETKRRKISGTHAGRNVGRSVAELLSWPDKEGDALGDWTSPEEVEVPGPKPRSGTKRMRLSRGAKYKTRADLKNAVFSRRRYITAARIFIERFGGYDMLSYDTKWEDVIPKECPDPNLKKFYGPTWSVGL
jgi:hypothetical protein